MWNFESLNHEKFKISAVTTRNKKDKRQLASKTRQTVKKGGTKGW